MREAVLSKSTRVITKLGQHAEYSKVGCENKSEVEERRGAASADALS